QNRALLGVRALTRTRRQPLPQRVSGVIRKQQQDMVERPIQNPVASKRGHRIAFLSRRRDSQDLRRIRRILGDKKSAYIAPFNRFGKDQQPVSEVELHVFALEKQVAYAVALFRIEL